MNLESLVLELYADTSRLDREVKRAVDRAASQIKKLERDDIEVAVNDESLHDLNKLLDVKQKHIKETAKVFKDNPLESVTSDSSTGGGSSGDIGGETGRGGLFGEVEKKLESAINNAIGKVGEIALAPIAGIGRGLFEGFGNEIAKNFTSGIMGSLNDSLDVNLKDLGKQSANAVTEGLFPQIKGRKSHTEALERATSATNDYPNIAKGLLAGMDGKKGFAIEKEQLKEIEKAYQRIVLESAELVKSSKSKKIPSNQDVASFGQNVIAQTQEIAEWSQWLESVIEQINNKAKLYKETESSIDEIQKRLDSAINTDNYGEVKSAQGLIETKKKELEKYKGDDFVDSLMDRLNDLQGQSIQDKKGIVKSRNMPSLKEYITSPIESMGLAADKGMATVAESMDEIKKDLITFAIESAKATVRGAIGVGQGTYKGLQAGEDMVFSLAPFGEAKKAKQIAQGVGKIAIPAAAFGAIGSLPGGHQLAELIVTLVKGALESGLNPLETGLITNIAEAVRGVTGVLPNAVGNPLANSLIAEIEGAIHAVVGLMTGGGAEIGAALIGGQGIRALAQGGIRSTGEVINNALAPSDERSKYLELAKESYNNVKTKFTGYLDRYQRIDEYIPMLPPTQQETARKGLKAAGSLQTMYSGDAEWQKASGRSFDLKQITSKNDIAKLVKQKGQKSVDNLFNWIQDQYKNAVKALEDFEQSYSVLPQDDRQSPELIGIKAELSKRVRLFRDKARFFGRKLEKDPNRASDVVTTAQKIEVPDLGKIARTATKKANVSDIGDDFWEVGAAQAEGIKTGFITKIPEVVDDQVSEIEKGRKAVKQNEGIASPSKRWQKEIGEPLGQGIEVGAIKSIQKAGIGISSEVGNLLELPRVGKVYSRGGLAVKVGTIGKNETSRQHSTLAQSQDIQGFYKKPDITGLKSRLAKVTNEDDLAALRDDYYYAKNYLLGIRKQIAFRLEKELGVLASRPVEEVNAKYDLLGNKIDSQMESALSPIKSQKERIKARFGKIRSRLTRERNQEIENAKLEDKLRQEQRDLINAKYDKQISMLGTKKARAFERASEMSLAQNDMPKDEFLQQELTKIRQSYNAKVAKVNQQRAQDLQEFAPTLPAVSQKYEARLSGLDIRESREMMPLNAQESQVKGRYSGLKSESEKRRQKELEQAQKYSAQMGSLNSELDKLGSSFRQKTIQYAGKAADNIVVGTEEYYDNFLGSLRDKLKDVLRLKGDEGDGLIDQVLTYITAGASTFSPGLMPAISAAPMMMPLIPTGLAALGVGNLIAPVIQRIDEALRIQDPIRQRFITLEGSQELGNQKQQEVMGIAQKYAIPVQPAVENFSQMAIAAQNTNLTAAEMMDLFEGISASIKALGLSTQDADLAFMAYTQMLSKGKVSMEELRQQLGERFPPAMSIFAKALGTSTAGLDDLVSKGAVMTDNWVPKVTKILKEDFGKAALEMGDNYVNAIARLDNVNFSISKKFADTYGGIFTVMKNVFAGVVKLMDDNFKMINALAISGLIAVGASIAIGTTFILKTPAIANIMKGGTNMLLSTFKFSLRALTPFLIGTLADVLDDILGADNNVFDNMAKGVSNVFTGIFSGIDQNKRNETGLGLFDPLQKIGNPFELITEGVKNFVAAIPSGLIEVTALVLMFEQVRVLGTMYIVPLFKDMAGAVWGWSKALADAVFNMGTAKRSLGDLFGGTLLGVSRSGVLEKYKDDFVNLRNEMKQSMTGGADANNRANVQRYREARESMITGFQQRVIDENPFAPPVTRRQAIQQLEGELKGLKQDMLSRVDSDPVVEYTKRRDALLKQRMRQESIARATMMAGSIALEAALAIGVLAFARGDFSNNLGGEINKGKKNILSAVESINNALKSMGNVADGAGKKLAAIKLPSKGVQLDIRNLFDPTKDFKWDDLVNSINDSLQQGNPVLDFFAKPVRNNLLKRNKDRFEEAQRLGIGDYFTPAPDLFPTMAQDQLLNTAQDIERLEKDVKNEFNTDIFNIDDLSQPINPKYRAVFDEISAIDSKVKALGGKRVKLAEINTYDSRKQIAELDKQINELLKERKDKVRPFIGLETGLKDFEAIVKSIEDAIANENTSSNVKQKLRWLLEPTKQTLEQLKSYFKDQGLLRLAQPLEDVWDGVVNKLQDVEFALMRVQNAQRVAFNKVQKGIYNNPQETPFTSQISTQKATLQDLVKQKDVLQKAYDSNYKSLQELLAVANIGDTSEKRAKIDELRKLVMDQESSISDLDLGIAKAQFDLKFNTSLEEEAIKTSRDIFNFNRSIGTQLIGIQNQFRDYNRQLEDAAINSAKMVRGLVESYNELNWELENNILTVQNELLDAQERLSLTNLKIQQEQFDPGQDTIGKRTGSIILKLFESINSGESEKRRRLQEANQAQKEYTDTLRRVRDFEEQVLQERMNQRRALEDLTTGFQNLNQAVKDLVLQLNQSREDLIRNTKNQSGRDISGSLAGVPSVGEMGVINQPQAYNATPIYTNTPIYYQPSHVRYGQSVDPQIRSNSPQDLYELTNKYGGNAQDFTTPSIPESVRNYRTKDPSLAPVTEWQNKPANNIQSSNFTSPPKINKTISAPINGNNDLLLAQLVIAEAKNQGLLGQALVARTVENRQRTNTPKAYLAQSNSLKDIIYARGQYEPVRSKVNNINTPRTQQELDQAYQAIELARDVNRLKAELAKQNLSASQITQLVNATGFRTPSAFADKSQQYNQVRFKGHIFNSDKNAKDKLRAFLHFGIPESIEIGQIAGEIESALTKDQRSQQAKPLPVPPPISNPRSTEFKNRVNNNNQPIVNKGVLKLKSDMEQWTLPSATVEPTPSISLDTQFTAPAIQSAPILPNTRFNYNPTQLLPLPTLKDTPDINSPNLNNILTPIPSFDTNKSKELGAQLLQLKSLFNEVELKNIDANQKLNELTAVSEMASLIQDVSDNIRQMNVNLIGSADTVKRITQESKGYLTISEEIQNIGLDTTRNIENEINSRKESSLSLRREVGDSMRQLAIQKEQLKNQDGISEETKNILLNNITGLENLINQKNTQASILDSEVQRLEQVKSIAVANKVNLETMQRTLEVNEQMSSLRAELANAKYSMGGLLFNTGAIQKAKDDYLAALQKIDLETKKMEGIKSFKEIEQYKKDTKELAEINIAKSYLDAIPALRDFSSGLKDIILLTSTWQEVAKKLLDTLAGMILDQLVILPMQNWLARSAGGLLGWLGVAGFAKGTDEFIPNYAGGLESAFNKEKMQSGKTPYLAVLHQGEAVLSTLNGDAQLLRSLKASGQWEHLKSNPSVVNYAYGSEVESRKSSQSFRSESQTTIYKPEYKIYAKDADSFRKSQGQIEQETIARMRRAKR